MYLLCSSTGRRRIQHARYGGNKAADEEVLDKKYSQACARGTRRLSQSRVKLEYTIEVESFQHDKAIANSRGTIQNHVLTSVCRERYCVPASPKRRS